MFNIILYNPQIPPNTGNIVRLSANTGCKLHLIKPIGFNLDEKSYRRAGLDYHDMLKVNQYEDLDSCLTSLENKNLYAITKFGSRRYSDVKYKPGENILFGSETKGLPNKVLDQIPKENQLYIPMLKDTRSLNLSNAVSLVAYEAWRQLSYINAVPFDKPK